MYRFQISPGVVLHAALADTLSNCSHIGAFGVNMQAYESRWETRSSQLYDFMVAELVHSTMLSMSKS